jgi:putative ABC transport system substrate-binding protein
MRRRDILTILGAAAASSVSWPLTVHAQQPARPAIGFLGNGTAKNFAPHVAAFRQGLKNAGIADGQHVIDFRWAQGRAERLPELARELVRRSRPPNHSASRSRSPCSVAPTR